jgi:anaerobic selenocysteine-containing dehydrogenase
MSRTALRICPLCEATCGLVLTVSRDGGAERVTGARGDGDDVFSHGYICPKGASFAELDNDPDRLRAPLIRRDGELVECGWDEALAAAVAALRTVLAVSYSRAPCQVERLPPAASARVVPAASVAGSG